MIKGYVRGYFQPVRSMTDAELDAEEKLLLVAEEDAQGLEQMRDDIIRRVREIRQERKKRVG
jgi:hypothetical protein